MLEGCETERKPAPEKDRATTAARFLTSHFELWNEHLKIASSFSFVDAKSLKENFPFSYKRTVRFKIQEGLNISIIRDNKLVQKVVRHWDMIKGTENKSVMNWDWSFEDVEIIW